MDPIRQEIILDQIIEECGGNHSPKVSPCTRETPEQARADAEMSRMREPGANTKTASGS